MSDIVDRITEVLQEFDPQNSELRAAAPAMAERVAAELQLTEETAIRKCYDPRCDGGGAHTHEERRLVSAWSEVTPTPMQQCPARHNTEEDPT